MGKRGDDAAELGEPAEPADAPPLVRTESRPEYYDFDLFRQSPAAQALDDVQETLQLGQARHVKTTLKTLLDKYAQAPYGFVELDVQWLVAALFRDGRALLSLNGQNLTLMETPVQDIVRYLTRAEYREKLVVENRDTTYDNSPFVDLTPEQHQQLVTLTRALWQQPSD